MPDQVIKCNVHSCKYNDKSRMCTLHDIVVGPASSSARSAKDTECDSFQCE